MCKFCDNFDFSRVGVDYDIIGSSVRPHVYHAGGNGTAPENQRFRFCPICGNSIAKGNSTNSKSGLTDDQLVRLLVCQAQGLDDYYGECNKLPDSGDWCFPWCPFGVTEDIAFFDKKGIDERRLLLMYYAAKRIAELSGIDIEIKIPYEEDE